MCFSNRLWFLAPWLKAVPGVAATVNQDLWSLCELQRDQTKKTSKKTKTSILNCSQPTSLIRFFHHQDVQICIGQKPLEMKLLLNETNENFNSKMDWYVQRCLSTLTWADLKESAVQGSNDLFSHVFPREFPSFSQSDTVQTVQTSERQQLQHY